MARRLSAFFTSSDSSSQPGSQEQNTPRAVSKAQNNTSAKNLLKLDTSSSSKPLPHSRSASHLPSLNNFAAPNHGKTLAVPQTAGPNWLPPIPPRPIPGAQTSRPSSAPGYRPDERLTEQPPPPNPAAPKLKKKSWGIKGKNEGPSSRAWIAGHEALIPYDLYPLIRASRVPELWDESGNTFVYLFPKSSNKGPSFRIDSNLLSSSAKLTQLAHGAIYSQRRPDKPIKTEKQRRKPLPSNTDAPVTPPLSPSLNALDEYSPTSSRGTTRTNESIEDSPRQIELYLPVMLKGQAVQVSSTQSNTLMDEDDIETLIATRNLFAFLVGQSLIATEKRPSIFSIFMNVADALRFYEFTNVDGSTFGSVASTSFDTYVQELKLADVRSSREQTIEALLLGERMRSVMLYNEAFTHAAGKYEDLQEILKFPVAGSKWRLISPITHKRLERAHLDLLKRQEKVDLRLTDFDFPSLFAGVMNSRTVDERKEITFKAWKEAFLATRRHALSYYKQKYGQWPPRAASKKNSLSRSGLNRIVLRRLYFDMADVYNLFVDRTSLTTRSDIAMADDEGDQDSDSAIHRIIRRVFDEYDRSMPPVQPPVPYDTPILPSAHSIRKSSRGIPLNPAQDQKARTARMSDEELGRILNASCNHDSLAESGKNPFVVSLLNMEHKAARGSTMSQLIDMRVGIWMFMYAVLQTLPMLVVDAPAVQHHQGCEYFLCEPPMSGVPWASGEAAQRAKTTWYNVSGGQGMVSLPSDLVEHGVEGVYRRSHCWIMASKWTAAAASGGPGVSVVTASPGQVEREMRNQVDQQLLAPHLPAALNASLPPPPIITEPYGGGGGVTVSRPGSAAGSRVSSRASSPSRGATASARESMSMINLGLEALPMPSGVNPISQSPNASRRSSAAREVSHGSMTFDQIIAGMEKESGKKGKRNSTR